MKEKSSILNWFCWFALFVVTCFICLVSFISYRWWHWYYDNIISDWQNWLTLLSCVLCVFVPIVYFLCSSKFRFINLFLYLALWAGLFWALQSYIKVSHDVNYSVSWLWYLMIIFHTLILLALWLYLILWFSSLWHVFQKYIIKYKNYWWQEIFLNFWIWLCAFLILVQILLGIGILYWIVSCLLFLSLWVLIYKERNHLSLNWEILSNKVGFIKNWILAWKWKHILILFFVAISLIYVYMGIQNSFIPYSTAWDANHEYMFIPKILAENHWIYWWNSVWNNMPWVWHLFLTFIFSLVWTTNWLFWMSADNVVISMNNISAWFVLVFWIAVIVQILNLIDNKILANDNDDTLDIKPTKNVKTKISDIVGIWWIIMWWSVLLLWLTSWMWAFLVMVDNKTDLWVMAFSLLALLSWLIFLQYKKNAVEKAELIKYIIIAWMLFGFSALAKITSFVDFSLFVLLLISLWFSSVTSLWVWLFLMWLVRKFNILTSSIMLTNSMANLLMILGLLIAIIWIFVYLRKAVKKEFWKNIKYLVILLISFIVPLFLFKYPWGVVSQLKTWNFSLWWSFKSVLLTYEDSQKWSIENKKKLVASNSLLFNQDELDASYKQKNNKTFSQCTRAWNIYSEVELNENLQELIWDSSVEDFWRYIWYWWESFWYDEINNQWKHHKNYLFWLLKILWPGSKDWVCYSFNKNAKILCENAFAIDKFEIEDLESIYNWKIDKDSEAWILLKDAIDSYNEAKESKTLPKKSEYLSFFYDKIVALRQYYQSHSIFSDSKIVNIPYRYLVPFNIVQNRSLQNGSSYYTDIWFIWVVVYILLIVSCIYAFYNKNVLLKSVSLITIIWWWIWWIIWSAILWYWTALIVWSMLTFVLWWFVVYSRSRKHIFEYISISLLTTVIVVFWLVQLFFNILRIISQWANSVFVWYKWNVWEARIYNERLELQKKFVYWYGWKNVFDLQFSHYTPIISALANRKNEDWVIVAWTYIQYFLWNQRNVKSDAMLNDFWRKTSDWDLCKTYRRLKNDNKHYIIIDPNIWTVTMGEWNESLFYRFFAKLNKEKDKILVDWALTSLVRLYKMWYVKLLSTNNIWAKYAFSLTDSEIRSEFWWNLTDDQIVLVRAKMAVPQYFDEANIILGHIFNIFWKRLVNNKKLIFEDIASIYWFEIDSSKLEKVMYRGIGFVDLEDLKNLTQDERTVIVIYSNLIDDKMGAVNSDMIQELVYNSLIWASQIVALELN